MKTKRNLILPLALSLMGSATAAHAGGWCELMPGWTISTHGTVADNVWIRGQFVGAPNGLWLQIASSTVGKNNVAVALSAQLAGKGLLIFLDSPNYTCENFPDWAPIGQIRHVQIKN